MNSHTRNKLSLLIEMLKSWGLNWVLNWWLQRYKSGLEKNKLGCIKQNIVLEVVSAQTEQTFNAWTQIFDKAKVD